MNFQLRNECLLVQIRNDNIKNFECIQRGLEVGFRNGRYFQMFLSLSPSELIGLYLIWPQSVCPFTLSDMNISETSWPIQIKFHLKHHGVRDLLH